METKNVPKADQENIHKVGKNDNAIQNWTDEELYRKCCFAGEQSLKWRYRFIGYLPEVNRRRLFEKKGFSSIFEFGKKLAGLSEEQIRLTLNLEKRFEDKPSLRAALVKGEVSINKLERVAFVATPENEEQLASQVKLLPRRALDTLVRDLRTERNEETSKSDNLNGLFEPKIEAKFTAGRESKGSNVQTLELSNEVTDKLLQLQRKGFDINELLLELLEKRKEAIASEKADVAAEMCGKVTEVTEIEGKTLMRVEGQIVMGVNLVSMEMERINLPKTAPKTSRYIPVKIKKVLHSDYGTKCAIPPCKKPSREMHHTDRHSLGKQHNPFYMAPLCKEHHQIAHSIDVKVQEKRREALRS